MNVVVTDGSRPETGDLVQVAKRGDKLFDFRPRDLLAGGKLKAVGKDRICAWPAFNAVWSAPSRS